MTGFGRKTQCVDCIGITHLMSIRISLLSEVSDFCSSAADESPLSFPWSDSSWLLARLFNPDPGPPRSACMELEVDMGTALSMVEWLPASWLFDDVIEDVIEAEVRLEEDSLKQKIGSLQGHSSMFFNKRKLFILSMLFSVVVIHKGHPLIGER